MAIKFTPMQQQVIDLRDCNILVSAAAGSGKTAVLVERIARMVCDETHPVDIDHLLVVTFTKAAAAEMRERIGKRIQELLKENPTNEHILKQSALVHKAQITTIDSFCLNIIRNHFQEIGIDPDFRILDEGEKKLLIQEVMDGLLEDIYLRLEQGDFAKVAENQESKANSALEVEAQEKRDHQSEEESLEEAKDLENLSLEDLANCVEYFTVRGNDKGLAEAIYKLFEYAESFPWPEDFLQERKQDYSVFQMEDLEKSRAGAFLLQYLSKMFAGIGEGLDLLKWICLEPDGPYMYARNIGKDRDRCFQMAGLSHLRDYEASIDTVFQERLSSAKDDTVDQLKREFVKNARNDLKKTYGKIKENFFTTPLGLQELQAKDCQIPMEMILTLAILFRKRILEEKAKKRVLDFSDMEHYALQILVDNKDGAFCPSAVAREYQQFYQEIMIDEYQDSNLVQELLLQAISKEDIGGYNRFMVGDVKQSIYSFRQARPELFLEKYNLYGDEKPLRRIDLAQNFRSRGSVLDSVNGIFERILSKEVGGIDYDDAAKLYVGASYPENPTDSSELILFDDEYIEQISEILGRKVSKDEAEGFVMALRIKKLLEEFKVTRKKDDKTEVVAASFRDIVILHRSPNGPADSYRRVFDAMGIPLVIPSNTGYFAATEISRVLQLLRTIENPRGDVPLFGTLISLFGGFSEEELAKLRIGRKQCALIDALRSYAEDENVSDDQLREKVTAFLSLLDNYREKSVYLSIRELLDQIFEDFHYIEYVTALPGGELREANVEMLLTKASDFEKTSYYGVHHFIRYMDQLEKYEQDQGSADVLDENADVIRLMSIHKSKGLEFPVTIVAGMGHKFNDGDLSESLIMDNTLGIGCKYIDTNRKLRNKTLRYNIVAAGMKVASRSEEQRVFYVALTRAKEKLIMVGYHKKADELLEGGPAFSQEALSFHDFVETMTPLDFLIPILHNTDLNLSKAAPDEIVETVVTREKEAVMKRNALKAWGESAPEEQVSLLKEQMEYEYPHQNLKDLYTKTTVTKLKEAAYHAASLMDSEDLLTELPVLVDDSAFIDMEDGLHKSEEEYQPTYIPRFRQEKEEITGTVRGNAYHRVMELLDYDRVLGSVFGALPEDAESYEKAVQNLMQTKEKKKLLSESIEAFLQEEVSLGRLSKQFKEAIFVRKLETFLTQKFAYRFWSAYRRGDLKREQPFVYGVEASRLDERFPREENLLIQGIIDAYLVEEDGICLLDYKTDKIDCGEDLWKRYNLQLCYYKEALEKLTGLPVKEAYLYSFGLGEFVTGELSI